MLFDVFNGGAIAFVGYIKSIVYIPKCTALKWNKHTIDLHSLTISEHGQSKDTHTHTHKEKRLRIATAIRDDDHKNVAWGANRVCLCLMPMMLLFIYCCFHVTRSHWNLAEWRACQQFPCSIWQNAPKTKCIQ